MDFLKSLLWGESAAATALASPNAILERDAQEQPIGHGWVLIEAVNEQYDVDSLGLSTYVPRASMEDSFAANALMASSPYDDDENEEENRAAAVVDDRDVFRVDEDFSYDEPELPRPDGEAAAADHMALAQHRAQNANRVAVARGGSRTAPSEVALRRALCSAQRQQTRRKASDSRQRFEKRAKIQTAMQLQGKRPVHVVGIKQTVIISRNK